MINLSEVIFSAFLLASSILGVMYGLIYYSSLVDRFMRYLLGRSTINHYMYTPSPAVVKFLINGLRFRIVKDAGMYSLQAKVWVGKWHNAELWDENKRPASTFTDHYVTDVEIANQRLKTIMLDVDVWLANFYDPKFVHDTDGVIEYVKYTEPTGEE